MVARLRFGAAARNERDGRTRPRQAIAQEAPAPATEEACLSCLPADTAMSWERAPWLVPYRWKPGVNGNPSGRPRESGSLAAALRQVGVFALTVQRTRGVMSVVTLWNLQGDRFSEALQASPAGLRLFVPSLPQIYVHQNLA